LLAGIRSRLTYANVVSTLCLFILLGGVAWAAATINSKDVIDNSLKSVDLKDGKGVQGADVAPGSLGGAAIDESSLGKVPSAASADSATDADTLDGKDSGDFAAAGSDGTVFMGSTGGNIGSGTMFVAPSGSSTTFVNEANAATLAPVAMVVTDLAFKVSQPPGIGAARTLTMRVNGVDTALSCTVTGVAQSCSASGPTVINPMDSIALAMSTGGAAPAVAIGQFGWRAETP
jgi:hypothetical protein